MANEQLILGDWANSLSSRAGDLIRAAELDPGRVRRQLVRTGLTVVASLLGFVGCLLFIRYGPALTAEAGVFAVIVLATFAALLAVSMVAGLVTATNALLLQHFQLLQTKAELSEAEEENAHLQEMITEIKGKYPEIASKDLQDLVK